MGRKWFWIPAAAAVVLVWALVAFVQTAEVRIASLPARVHAELRVHGGRYVTLGRISPWIPKAIVATEDQTFWTNWGISIEGTLRAAVVDIETLSFAQGGSTLTQELARDEFLGDAKTIGRKLTGTAYALLITRRYPKREILELYLNEVYFGHGAWGIDSAARTYFGLPPRSLDLAQSAMVVGLVQAPSYLDPLKHLGAARARQHEVLQALVRQHEITAAQAASAAASPLGLV